MVTLYSKTNLISFCMYQTYLNYRPNRFPPSHLFIYINWLSEMQCNYFINCTPHSTHRATTMAASTKPVMIVGVDESEQSFYALEWTLDHFLVPSAPNPPFNLIIVHSKPTPVSSMGFTVPGVDIMSHVDADLKKIANRVVEKAKELCVSKSVTDATIEIVEGDARNVLCDAVERHHATILAVGSHGHGAIKRAVLGSVSDYVSHHAHCTVMIVKKPKGKHEGAHH
ncbi:putative universal stress protein A family [Helianthus annuus]|nr:putative universal stress protein A family [Helianthus annuus]KAJ0878315.1 putative universal stress protein A family [Helianthus annuus]KAJ0882567.1 putative universal stress protein A [Helianthus annuus]